MRILVVADGSTPLLHHSVVGLADRGHRVRVAGALSGDELDPVARFRLGASLWVRPGPDGAGPLVGAGRVVAGLVGAAVVDPRRLAAVVGRTRRTVGLGPDFRRRMARALPVIGERADVVYIEAAYVAAEMAPLLDRLPPVLVMCTGSDVRIMPDLQPRLAELLPAVLAQAARVTCRSDDLRDCAIRRGAPAGRTSVLRAGADRHIFVPSPRPPRRDGVLRLLSVGRLHWVKSYERAVEAVARARDRGANLSYTIVGPDRGAGEAVDIAIRDLHLDDVVTRTGPASVPEVRAAMARADALVISSVSEGVSRSAYEAMAMGLPVIATDSGGMAELVTDGVEGLVVPCRDTDALAGAITKLAGDRELLITMGQRALARSQEFDADTHLDRLEQVLTETATLGRAAG